MSKEANEIGSIKPISLDSLFNELRARCPENRYIVADISIEKFPVIEEALHPWLPRKVKSKERVVFTIEMVERKD